MTIIAVPLTSIKVEKSGEPSKTPAFVSFGLVALAWLANEVALAFIHDRVPRDTPPLPDLWFGIFPEITGAIRVTEAIMLTTVISMFAMIVCHQHRWIVARRVFFCVALCYGFRAICITLIQVPVPSVKTYCAPKGDGSLQEILRRVVKDAWSAGIEQLRARQFCGDLIVSGHTISLFISVLAFKQYAPRKLTFLAHLYIVAALVAIVCILIARKHYTIDVFFGYCISTRVFWTYHSLSTSFHNGDLEKNALCNSCWAWMIPYFERDAPPPHLFLNRLIWPSSCPQRIRRRWA